MSFQVICVLSLLVAGALSQSDLGATAGEYVPANEALIYEAGGEQSWNKGFDSSHYVSYYFYSVPSANALADLELRYVAWAGYDPKQSGFPNNGNHYEYVVGWTPHCDPTAVGAKGGGTCGFAAYQIDASQLPTTWSELRVTRPRNFETTFHKPVSVDVGSEFEWDGHNAGSTFQMGSPDFWYTLWYIDSAGKAYQMQCKTTVDDANGGDQFQPPTSSNPGTTDSFVGCTDAATGSGSAWVPATVPTTYDGGHTFKLWRVSSGGRAPGSGTFNTQGSCNVAFIDTDVTSGSPTTSSFNDANGNAINKGRIWWGGWSITSPSSACAGSFVPVGGSSPDNSFISVGNGYDSIWAIQDNGDGTTTLRSTPVISGFGTASSLPPFARTTSTSQISHPQLWHDGGWTASSRAIQVDSYDCARTYVIDSTYGLWRASASVSSSDGSCVVSGWTQVVNSATDNVKVLDISVGPISAYVTLLTGSGERQFRLDH